MTAGQHRRPHPRDLRPPKSLEELAREQGISLEEPPDIDETIELLSGVWRTKKEVQEFQRFVRSIRRRPHD